MRPLRIRLQEAWREPGLQSYVVERDYLLSWVLDGISAVPELRETLVFKGGTALKKCYFDDYRFSEDLDFSGQGEIPTEGALADAMDRACGVARDLLAEYAEVEMHCERHVENNPHPSVNRCCKTRPEWTGIAASSSELISQIRILHWKTCCWLGVEVVRCEDWFFYLPPSRLNIRRLQKNCEPGSIGKRMEFIASAQEHLE